MTKYQMTKEIRMTNDKDGRVAVVASSLDLPNHSSFELRHSFVIGSFVIRHSRKEAT